METRKMLVPIVLVIPDKIEFKLEKNNEIFTAVYTEGFGEDVPEDIIEKSLSFIEMMSPNSKIKIDKRLVTIEINHKERKMALSALLGELIFQCCESKYEFDHIALKIREMLPDAKLVSSPLTAYPISFPQVKAAPEPLDGVGGVDCF